MKLEISENTLSDISADGVLVFAFEDEKTLYKSKSLTQIDKALDGELSEYLKTEDYKGKLGNIVHFLTGKKILAQKVFVLGLGDRKKFEPNILRKALSLFAKHTKGKLNSIALSKLQSSEGNIETGLQVRLMTEGLMLGSYEFAKYKKQEESKKDLEIVIFSEVNSNTHDKIKKGFEQAELYYNATKLARDLVNEPSSVVTPTFLASLAQDIAKSNPEISCKVYDRQEAQKMGMEAFLGVAWAADTPPKFIHLEYSPSAKKNDSDNTRKLAIVGKGITFDTGGINVKPGESMTTMKIDMSGAATVLGVFSVISRIMPDYPVMGIIAATPNMISGKSLVPGDVLRAMNGKTIEILNTDAEGRVTMADSLSYAVKEGATEIIDLATLTGACMIALGAEIAALFSNNESLKERIKKAADSAGEKMWELPLIDDYKDLNKSEVADISNIPSTRYGGTITAALFLQEFIDNKPWAHLDIAGTAYADKGHDFGPKGGTGYGVRTILDLLKQ